MAEIRGFTTAQYAETIVIKSESVEKKVILKGERDLISAILARAISDLFHTRKRHRRIKQSAKRWIISEDNCILSFVWCCHLLDMDPDEIRLALRNLQRPNYIRGDVLERLR